MNYFSDKELSCKCCGVNGFKASTLKRLNKLRELVGVPLILNSAYRCEKYNRINGYTQTHATGQAVDIKCNHKKSIFVLRKAMEVGFTGFGIKQRGKVPARFIHLDDLPEEEGRPRPHLWSY